MTPRSDVDFLSAKLDALCAAIPDEPSRANVRLLFGGIIAKLKKGDEPAKTRLIKLELTMEQMIAHALSPAEKANVDGALKRSFGYASLGKSPIAIVNQALRRGNISNEEEAQVIRMFISNLANEQLVGSRKFDKLALLMVAYGD